MRRRTFLYGAMGTAIAATAVGCGGQQSSGGATGGNAGGGLSTIRVGHYFNENHPNHKALVEVFKPEVEQASNGEIEVQVFPNSQLGDEEAMSNGVRNGSIEMAVPGMLLANADRRLGLAEFPFLFNDHDHARRALDGDTGQFMVEACTDLGLKHMGWSLNGFRVISSNRAITKMDDFQGFRLRMPNVPVYIMCGEALGATITPMAITEIFTALEQGVIDGQENPYLTVLANGWYEVQSHMIETYHLMSPNMYLFNLELFNSLDADTQQLITAAADKSSRHAWNTSVEEEKTVKQELEGHGMEIIIPDESFRTDLHAAMDGVYAQLEQEFDWAGEQIEIAKSYA